MTPMCLNDLRRCFDGRVPAVIATASASGIPNITYLTAVHQVDGERVALSNQFMSKTTRNLIENGFASLLLIDPVSYSEYRLAIRYERTERRGPIFERLRADVDKVAGMTGMRDVFRLRAADVYYVEEIDVVVDQDSVPGQIDRRATVALAAVATLTGRLSRCTDLDSMVSVALDGLDDLFGISHSSVLLVDESGERLYTLASHGFASAGVGSEVPIGDGVVGAAARECRTVRVGALRQMRKYANTVRRSFERTGYVGPGLDIEPPTLDDAESRIAVPAIVRGELVGVLVADSALAVAFDESDEAALGIIATLIAEMIDSERSNESAGGDDGGVADERDRSPRPATGETRIRFFPVDGSVFLDGDYL
ncbi:MAG: GAF domain-containing protein, partial [Acidimicrobiia bacterium]